MTDYAAEQEEEMEALHAILMEDLEEVDDSVPPGWKTASTVWRVALTPQLEEGEAEAEYPLRLEIVFAHTPTYPDEPPLVKARGLRGLSDADMANLQVDLDAEVQANLGTPMIYTLVTRAQEWLQDKAASVGGGAMDPEVEKRRALDAEEARVAALRSHGHTVTPESFAEWKAAYDARRALQRAALGGPAPDAAAAGKEGRISGKRWFQMQEEQHVQIEEPELEADEADGEDDRENWGASASEEESEEEEEDSDDEDFAAEFLKEKVGGD